MSFGYEAPIKGATDTWLTPLEIIEALGSFDLDPCGRDNHKTARIIYSLPKDGLSSAWDPTFRIWLNPPYSKVGDWLEKLASHPKGGVALVFARVDTSWAQKFMPLADSIFFPKGRLTFLRSDLSRPKGNAGAPSMFLSFREHPDWLRVMPGWVAK